MSASLTAPDPDFRQRIDAFLRSMPIVDHLGLRVLRLEPGRCDLELPYRRDFAAAEGVFMAGAIGTVGDIAAALAGATLLPSGWIMSTIDFTLKVMAPARGDALRAQGRTLRAGRTLTVNAADILVLDGGRARLCASLLMTASNREATG
jgi:uncharacterized protein (TIGR00369 family)